MLRTIAVALSMVILGMVGRAVKGPAAPVKTQVFPLTMQLQNGSLHLQSQKLGSSVWPDGVGEARFEIERGQRKQDVASGMVKYSIEGGILSATISHLDRDTLQSDLTVRLAGIKDAKGINNVTVFKGRLQASGEQRFSPASPGVEPARQNTADDGSGAGSVPAVKMNNERSAAETPSSRRAGPLSAASPTRTLGLEPPAETTPARAPLSWLIYSNIVITLILVAFAAWLAWQQLALPKPRPDQVSKADLAGVKQISEEAQITAGSALRGIAELKKTLAGQGPTSAFAKEDLEEMVRTSLEAQIGPVADLQRALKGLQQASKAQTTTTSSRVGADWEQVSLTAIVNRWWKGGGQDTGELLRLAENLGSRLMLMRHKNLDSVFQDVTTFEYPFETSERGPWLFAPIGNTSEVWAAPFDHSYFRMGLAPSLLDRLFEGLKDKASGFRFSRLYRPCRLRPVSGKPGYYSVVQKGVLQLQGAPPPPDAAPPLEYDSLHGVRKQEAATTNPPALGRALAEWLAAVSSRLEEQSTESRTIQQEFRELAAAALKRDSLQNGPEEIQNQVSYLEKSLTSQIESVRRDLALLRRDGERVAAVVATLKNVEELQPARSVAKAVASAAAQSPSAVTVSEQRPMPQNPSSPPKPAALRRRIEWQHAWKEAANHPDAEPAFTDVPSPALYVRRVNTLAATLGAQSPETPVAVVHLKKHASEDTFELHRTEASSENPQELFCPSCNSRQSWQVAVCIGAVGAGDVELLYPQGQFGKGNYAPGYSALIDDLAGATFFIAGIEQPAELRFLESSGFYSVRKKLTWTKTAQTVGGQP